MVKHRKDVDLMEQVQRQAMKVIGGVEHLCCGARLRTGVTEHREKKASLCPHRL